jgi:hypothetical protein
MRSLFGMFALVLLSGCALGSHWTRASNTLPDFTDAPGAWRSVKVPMSDGVKLHTRVLLPENNDGTRPSPLVIIRNAYPHPLVYAGECDLLARYGIGCVVQDIRGRGESEVFLEPVSALLERTRGERVGAPRREADGARWAISPRGTLSGCG